ncbi:MAG: general secretion pathway protein GspK [Deltaproteobacteria bacterium]|nr:general secretion pathway protein GspK [Deltaproteobacteria bacterium]
MALLTVLVAMMIMTIMILEFQYSAMVERKLAYNEVNVVQAYYLAKSGVRFGLLRIAMYARAKAAPELKKVPLIQSYLDMLWNVPLPAFPPEAASVKKMESAERSEAEKTLKETRVDEGQSTHVITTESSKINLNYLVVPKGQKLDRINFNSPPQGLHQHVAMLLYNLIERFIRESENPNEEFGNLRPEETVYDIMDWVNQGSDRLMGGNKDTFYEQQTPPYKAKRNRFYTVDELRLVRGIDGHLFSKLKPYVTVYSADGKININTAAANLFRAIYPDFTDDDIKRLLEERAKIGGWTDVNTFVKYVTDTLGRSRFKDFYTDPNQYPFTVNSQSFIVESMGAIRKSKSQVQKIIRVAVALEKGKGNAMDPSAQSQAQCNQKKGYHWHPINQLCMRKATTSQECLSIWSASGAGAWDDATKCCKPLQIPAVCLTEEEKKATAAQEPNALKILHWSET